MVLMMIIMMLMIEMARVSWLLHDWITIVCILYANHLKMITPRSAEELRLLARLQCNISLLLRKWYQMSSNIRHWWWWWFMIIVLNEYSLNSIALLYKEVWVFDRWQVNIHLHIYEYNDQFLDHEFEEIFINDLIGIRRHIAYVLSNSQKIKLQSTISVFSDDRVHRFKLSSNQIYMQEQLLFWTKCNPVGWLTW